MSSKELTFKRITGQSLLEYRILLERRLVNYWLGSLGPLRLNQTNGDLLRIWFSSFPLSEKAVTSSVDRFSNLDLLGRLQEVFHFASNVKALGLSAGDFFSEDLSTLLHSSFPKAFDTLERVSDYIQVFSLGQFLEEHQLLTYAGYHLMEFCGALTTNLKYHLISMFNMYWFDCSTEELAERNLPKRSSVVIGKPGQLWAGPTLRYFRMKVYGQSSYRRTKRRPDFWEIALNSLFQGWKKGLLPVSLEEVTRSVKEHSVAMKNVPTHEVDDLVAEVRRTVRDLHFESDLRSKYDKQYLQSTKFSKLWNPSRHACVESNFGNFGFLGEFLRNTSYWGATVNKKELLLGLALRTEFLVGYKTTKFGVEEIRTKYLFYQQKEEIHSAVRKAVMNFELPRAIPATVLEPNKARIITKGEYASYLALKPYQRQFWSLLQKFPQFQLVGHKLNSEILHVVGKGFCLGDVFVSGDYKSATDNFDYRLTRACVEELCRHLTPVAKQLCLRGLGPHEIHYLPWKVQKSKDIELSENYLPRFWEHNISSIDNTVTMNSAQLMGSPLSFIVLCIVNFALTRKALEAVKGRRYSIRESPILINGDDVLFPISPSGVEVWRETVTRGGLSPSPGKNYVSSEFVQLNSEVYKVIYSEGTMFKEIRTWREEQRNGTCNPIPSVLLVSEFMKIPYLNFGLMLDRHKDNSSVTEKAGQFNFHSQYRDMIAGLRSPVTLNVLEKSTELFERHYREDLECFSFLDKNAPLALGGLGLRPWLSHLAEPSEVSAYCLETGASLPEVLVKNSLSIDPWTGYKTILWEPQTKPEKTSLMCELKLQLKRYSRGQFISSIQKLSEKAWNDLYEKIDIPVSKLEEVSY